MKDAHNEATKIAGQTISIQDVILKADHRGLVFWMSDWTKWPGLVRAGLLRAVHGGPGTYGHLDLYLSTEG